MTRFLITGVSSGIGRELTKELVKRGDRVWGISRRTTLLVSLKKELNGTERFRYSNIDITKPKAWVKVVTQMKLARFSPQVVIFNAAIFEKDYLGKKLDFSQMRKSFEVNFFSIIKGFEELVEIVKPRTQFIFISSSSAFKGSGTEGIGYPASKAALSVAFESLYQKYKGRHRLKILYFGPINTDMLPSVSRYTPVLSKDQAVEKIIKTIHSNKAINYSPWYLFLFLRIIKILPVNIYLTILSLIDILHLKSSKK